MPIRYGLQLRSVTDNLARMRRCPACRQLFEPTRSDARFCSNRCRQKRYRRRHRKKVLPPWSPDDDLIQDDPPDVHRMTEEDRWHWSAAYLFGDIVAADAYWRREFGDWQDIEPANELLVLLEQATEELQRLAVVIRRRR
jgi:hypothetical protein